MTDLWTPLSLSLQIALVATALTALVGVPLAFTMSRARFAGRSVIDALITVPLVLPPTVVGYYLIMLLGANGWIGQYLHRAFDYSILFRIEGAILAAAVVALPMLYMPAKAAFAGVDRELEDVARLFGATRLQTFWHVSLPLARRGLASGLLLAFARALGEFGATVMVLGWQSRRVTLPISIYADFEQGEWGHATAAVVLLSIVSLALMLAYNRSALGGQER
jgi:molybdate transport system permease protein